MTAIEEIVENFGLLDEWDDRYRYVIELGRTLTPLPDEAHVDANKVQGCASQVWLLTDVKPNGASGPTLTFQGDSDAHIVRGLIAILFALYSGKSARDILAIDSLALFDRIGLRENLTPQRSNGLRSMVERIRAEAKAALAEAAWLAALAEIGAIGRPCSQLRPCRPACSRSVTVVSGEPIKGKLQHHLART
jgi:cysteine desulfuration protein SufE